MENPTRREALAGILLATPLANITQQARAAPVAIEPVDAGPAVFVLSFPPGESATSEGDISNDKLALQIVDGLRLPGERWVAVPGAEWLVQCCLNRPYKISPRRGVELDWSTAPVPINRIWDEATGEDFANEQRAVTYANTLTGEVRWYDRNKAGQIELPRHTAFVADLRADLAEE